MNIDLLNGSEVVLEYIIGVGIPLIVGLVFFVLALIGGAEAGARMRVFARRTRKYVDEPTDAIVVGLTGIGEFVLKRDLDPDHIAKILTAVMDAVGQQQEFTVGDKPVEAVK